MIDLQIVFRMFRFKVIIKLKLINRTKTPSVRTASARLASCVPLCRFTIKNSNYFHNRDLFEIKIWKLKNRGSRD